MEETATPADRILRSGRTEHRRTSGCGSTGDAGTRYGFVAKFTFKTESPGFVSAERAYSWAYGEITVVEIGPKIKLRNKTVAIHPNPADSLR
jgi:hypothetical protein